MPAGLQLYAFFVSGYWKITEAKRNIALNKFWNEVWNGTAWISLPQWRFLSFEKAWPRFGEKWDT